MNEYKYMLLSRLQQDCEYFLKNGNGCVKHLYALNVKEHINLMKKIYNSFSADERPTWLSYKKILNYELKMEGKL